MLFLWGTWSVSVSGHFTFLGINPRNIILLLLSILTRAPNVFSSEAESSPQKCAICSCCWLCYFAKKYGLQLLLEINYLYSEPFKKMRFWLSWSRVSQTRKTSRKVQREMDHCIPEYGLRSMWCTKKLLLKQVFQL